MKYKIVKILKLIFKIITRPSNFNLYYGLYKISKIKRYQEFHTSVIGKDMRVTDSKSFLSCYREIFENKIYKFKSNLDSPYIIDCGASIGLGVIYFKKIYPNSKIIAFEPDIKTFEALEYNISSWQFKDVEIINKGVSNTEGEAKFYAEGADGGRIAKTSDNENIIEIKTTRLIKYLNKPVDLLKIDIEGAEYDVLSDCKDYMTNVNNLFVEYHSFIDQPQKLDIILKLIKEAGFKYYISQSGTAINSPLVERKTDLSMDLQLDIFAYRV